MSREVRFSARQVRRGAPGQLEEILAFADAIFAETDQPDSLRDLLPAVYGPGAGSEAGHYLLYEDGALAGLLYRQDFDWQTAPGQTVRGAGVGSVCVAPACRGRGVMGALMEALDADLQSEGMALAVLSGQRQRYRHFGYEMAGAQLTCHVERENVSHSFKGGEGIRFEPLAPGGAAETEAFALFSSRPVRVLRQREAFAQILCGWRSEPYAAWDGGDFLGYFSLDRRGPNVLWEIDWRDGADAGPLMAALFRHFELDALRVLLDPRDAAKRAFFEGFCQNRELAWNHNYRLYAPQLLPPAEQLYLSYLDCV